MQKIKLKFYEFMSDRMFLIARQFFVWGDYFELKVDHIRYTPEQIEEFEAQAMAIYADIDREIREEEYPKAPHLPS